MFMYIIIHTLGQLVTPLLRTFCSNFELTHRLPANDHLKGHVKALLSTMFFLLEVENEENVLVCLRIIIDLHKQFRPSFSTEVRITYIHVDVILSCSCDFYALILISTYKP